MNKSYNRGPWSAHLIVSEGELSLTIFSVGGSYNISRVMRKPVFGGFYQFRHKPRGTATEDRKRLEISDLGRRGIVLIYVEETKALNSYRAADLDLCFLSHIAKVDFLIMRLFSGSV